MKKDGNHIIRLFMLAASFVLLLTVVIPHHHHDDGMPCIHLFEHSEGEDGESHQHTCDCVGHDLAFNSNILQDNGENDITLLLMPLFTVADYAYPPDILTSSAAFPSDGTVYIESLHSTWIPAAAGLRAPPFVIS